MEQSVAFASAIQNELKKSSKRSDRGVRQAGFLVLRETSMPSVLVELGFISNPAEETFMISAIGQQSLANSLFNAFTQYKNDYDRKSGYYLPADQESNKTTSPSKSAPVSTSTTKTESKPATPPKTELKPAVTVVKPSQNATTQNPPSISAKTTVNSKCGVVYKIQLLASSSVLTSKSPQLKGYKTEYYMDTDGLYKYTFGSTTNVNEINQLKAAVKKDFPDAFMVKFVNGERIK
jgi:N-acetylmuramoyl-L-alanine amidase